MSSCFAARRPPGICCAWRPDSNRSSDLQGIVRENLGRRESELARAEAIVAEELARFTAWLRSRRVVPTVVALRERFETIRQSELRRLEPRLASLTPEARARVDEITHLIVEKLLLTPTEQLKSLGDDRAVAEYADAVSRLFALGPLSDDRPVRRPESRARA
jgi:glutamyl-tRNA reductase